MAAIELSGSILSRRRAVWRLGNIQPLSYNGATFLVGRSATREKRSYSEERRAFEIDAEEFSETSRVVLDLDWSTFAVAPNPRLAQSPRTIAAAVGRLLNAQVQSMAGTLTVSLTVEAVRDPSDFVSALESAYRVDRFRVRLPRPNAFDAERDFVKPVESGIASVNGVQGTITVKGDRLDAAALANIARSAALIGAPASARLYPDEAATKPVLRQLGHDAAAIEWADLTIAAQQQALLVHMRKLMASLRGYQNG